MEANKYFYYYYYYYICKTQLHLYTVGKGKPNRFQDMILAAFTVPYSIINRNAVMRVRLFKLLIFSLFLVRICGAEIAKCSLRILNRMDVSRIRIDVIWIRITSKTLKQRIFLLQSYKFVKVLATDNRNALRTVFF